MTDTQEVAAVSASEAAVDAAVERATAHIADTADGWETTAAVLAYEVVRLRGQCPALVVSVAQALRSAIMGSDWVARHPWDDPDSDHEPYLTWAQAAIDRALGR
jgi:hypothetical protein